MEPHSSDKQMSSTGKHILIHILNYLNLCNLVLIAPSFSSPPFRGGVVGLPDRGGDRRGLRNLFSI